MKYECWYCKIGFEKKPFGMTKMPDSKILLAAVTRFYKKLFLKYADFCFDYTKENESQKYWECKIGSYDLKLGYGADFPIRMAIEDAHS